MDGIVTDIRRVEPARFNSIMLYTPSSRTCEVSAFIEIRALDALTNTYLPDAMFTIGGIEAKTYDYRLSFEPSAGWYGGYFLREGDHTFEISRAGYVSQVLTLSVPSVCEGDPDLCLPDDVIYREIFMVPKDGKTRVILNWGDLPADLDILVLPIGVSGLNEEPVVWTNKSGGSVSVYDYETFEDVTTTYGPGRYPYASWNMYSDGTCACEYTCVEGISYPFVCTHYGGAREQCIDYEKRHDILPRSEPGFAPLCVLENGERTSACCCNPPDEAGSVTCKGENSDAWCCPQKSEVPGTLCTPDCLMQTTSEPGLNFSATISIDRDEAGHNMPKGDTDGKAVNRPEIATLSNLLPGMYKIYVNAYAPTEEIDRNFFGKSTAVSIYLGDGQEFSLLVDVVTFTRGNGKWFYAGYIFVTNKHSSCLSSTKVEQKGSVEGLPSGLTWKEIGVTQPSEGEELTNSGLSTALLSKTEFNQQEWEAFGISDLRVEHFIKSGISYFKAAGWPMCYAWYKAGYLVNNPLALRYAAVFVRIAKASGRSGNQLTDFSGVQFSVHAYSESSGGSCSCSTAGCGCTGSALVHAGLLGPSIRSNEAAEGWQITSRAIFYPVESGLKYSMILTHRDYFDEIMHFGASEPDEGGETPIQSAVMVQTVRPGQLRIVFSWKAIEDGDMYIFKDPIPGTYKTDEEGEALAGNTPFVWWSDTAALPGIRLEQDCTTKECGVETIFFENDYRHNDATYSVAVNVFAGVGQDRTSKCVLAGPADACKLQGTSSAPDEKVEFFDQDGRLASVSYFSR